MKRCVRLNNRGAKRKGNSRDVMAKKNSVEQKNDTVVVKTGVIAVRIPFANVEPDKDKQGSEGAGWVPPETSGMVRALSPDEHPNAQELNGKRIGEKPEPQSELSYAKNRGPTSQLILPRLSGSKQPPHDQGSLGMSAERFEEKLGGLSKTSEEGIGSKDLIG